MDTHQLLFRDKKIFIIATMGLFSGDGAGVSARFFKKYGATVIGGLHLKMPDCIGDEKVLKKTLAQNKLIVKQAETKLQKMHSLQFMCKTMSYEKSIHSQSCCHP